MNVAPEQEIEPQLRRIGIEPEQVRTVVLTHFRTDHHAGGVHHVPTSEILSPYSSSPNGQPSSRNAL